MSEVYIILYLHYEFMIRIKLLNNKKITGTYALLFYNPYQRVKEGIFLFKIMFSLGGRGGACEYMTIAQAYCRKITS